MTVGEFSVRYQVRWGDGHETIISPEWWQRPHHPNVATHTAIRHLLSAFSPTVYAGQRLNHRESGGTADAPDLGSGARKGVGARPTACSAPTAPARRPRSRWSAAAHAATPGGSPWAGRTARHRRRRGQGRRWGSCPRRSRSTPTSRRGRTCGSSAGSTASRAATSTPDRSRARHDRPRRPRGRTHRRVLRAA